MAGAFTAILFVAAMVGLIIWSWIFLSFAAHYFLATLIDSSAGHDDIYFAGEHIMDLWWKPVFCLWIVVFWVFIGSVLLGPCMVRNTIALIVYLSLFLWFVYPVSLLSTLGTHNWLHMVHAPIVWRLLRHYVGFAYVYLITFLFVAAGAVFLAGMFRHNFLWAVPAAFALPTALLIYARHWGRFAWFALNEHPKKKKRRRAKPADPTAAPSTGDTPGAGAVSTERMLEEEEELEEEEASIGNVPPKAAHEIDPAAGGISQGLPPAFPHAFQTELPVGVSDGNQARLQPQPVVEEQEDEWSTQKKPYQLMEESPQPSVPVGTPNYARETTSDADQPITFSNYYDEQARRDEERQERIKTKGTYVYRGPKYAPTFWSALVTDVWVFMIYSGTIQVWINLAGLTIVELGLLYLAVSFWPAVE